MSCEICRLARGDASPVVEALENTVVDDTGPDLLGAKRWLNEHYEMNVTLMEVTRHFENHTASTLGDDPEDPVSRRLPDQ